MPDTHLLIATAGSDDVPLLLTLIKELAGYEHLAHSVTATDADIRACFFGDQPVGYAILARYDEHVIGFGVYFFNLSTFCGHPGLYVEDLYVRPAWRGRGFGRALLSFMARTALEHGCDRMEWAVLDWNGSAHRFYDSLGAQARREWLPYRITGVAFSKLANVTITPHL